MPVNQIQIFLPASPALQAPVVCQVDHTASAISPFNSPQLMVNPCPAGSKCDVTKIFTGSNILPRLKNHVSLYNVLCISIIRKEKENKLQLFLTNCVIGQTDSSGWVHVRDAIASNNQKVVCNILNLAHFLVSVILPSC